MAQVTVSPGIFTQENDQSFVPTGLAQIGASLVGLFDKGPAFQPVNVATFGDFRSQFGNLDTKLYAPYAANSYLQNSSSLNVVRVLSTQTIQNVGQAIILAFGNTTASMSANVFNSSCTAMAILRARNGVSLSAATISGSSNNFTLGLTPGGTANNLSLNSSDPNYVGKVLGTDPFSAKSGDILPTIYVQTVFDYSYFASASTNTVNVLANNAYSNGLGGYTSAQTPPIVSQNYNGQVYNLFQLFTLSDGDAANTDIKISISMDTSQIASTAYPTFVVSVRDFNDTDARPVVLESFTCVLDPNATNYIARVIGDRTKTFNTTVDPPELIYDGDYQNNSKYIRVSMFDGYPQDAKPSGFSAIPAMQVGPNFITPYKLDNTNLAGNKDSKIYMGYNTLADSNGNRLSFLTTGISAVSTGIALGFLISTLTAENSSTASLINSYVLVNATTGNPATATTLYNAIKFTVPTYGGWDGIDIRDDKIQLLNDGSLSADFINAIKVLGNPDELDFNLIAVPGMFAGGPASQGNIPSRVVDMVESRGDAFYIMDLGDNTQTTVTGAILNSTVNGVVQTAQSFDTNYAATYFPSVKIFDNDNNKYVWVPSSTVVLGAFAFNDKVGQLWFAPAGLNRGVLNVFEARKRLTQTQKDTLYLGKVNPISTFAGQGIVIWGQKTLQFKASALDRVNVRRLLLYARKTIASIAKYFVFEPNNAATRSNLVNAINPILQKIQTGSGLEQYKVVCDATNNTSDTIDRNLLIGDFYLQPSRTSEIFIFTFNITRSGVSFNQ